MTDEQKLRLVMAWAEKKPELTQFLKWVEDLWEDFDENRSAGYPPTLKCRDRAELDRLILIIGIK